MFPKGRRKGTWGGRPGSEEWIVKIKSEGPSSWRGRDEGEIREQGEEVGILFGYCSDTREGDEGLVG